MEKIIWSKEAGDDLNELYFYLNSFSEKLAEKYTNDIFTSIETLIKNPKLGRKVPEINIESIRELIVGNYRVIYQVTQKSVEIIAIKSTSKPLI